MEELDDVMQSKVDYIRKTSSLHDNPPKIPKPKVEKAKKGKKKLNYMEELPFGTAQRINHFYEIGWADPKIDLKTKPNEPSPAGPCPFP